MDSDIDILNKKLSREYITIDGHKIFRLIWSESTFENRYGTFREFTEGGLFLREVTETRRVRKYNYIHNRWIFEMWAPGNLVANRETPDAINGDYVPIYVFESRDGNYLPPNEKVVRFLISALHGKVRKDEIPSQEYLEEREVQKFVESMDDHPSDWQTRPGAARNAIWYAGGIPEWHERRATFDPAMAIIEHEAIQIAKEKALKMEREREEKLELARINIREVIRERDSKRELELAKEAKDNRELIREASRQEPPVPKAAPEVPIPPVIETRSPFHRRNS